MLADGAVAAVVGVAPPDDVAGDVVLGASRL
jgi:hypothetical protein